MPFNSLAFAVAFGAIACFCVEPRALAQGSGKFERTQPAAPAPAAPSAPSKPDQFVEQLRRKATAGESDNGFCATVPWTQLGENFVPRLFVFYDRAARGAIFTSKNMPYGCAFLQVTSTGRAVGGGERCVTFVWHECHNGPCRKTEAKYVCARKDPDPKKRWEEHPGNCRCQ
jgi:hypothetical protein